MVIIKVLVLVGSILLALVILRYKESIVRTVGKNELAERYLGNGGTYTFWTLFAIIIILIALVWLIGFRTS